MNAEKLKIFFAKKTSKERAEIRKKLIERLNIANSSFSRKLNEDGRKFTEEETKQIAEILNEPVDELFDKNN